MLAQPWPDELVDVTLDLPDGDGVLQCPVQIIAQQGNAQRRSVFALKGGGDKGIPVIRVN